MGAVFDEKFRLGIQQVLCYTESICEGVCR